jgi:hypothetical protein
MVIVATYFVTSLLSLPHVIQLINFFCRLLLPMPQIKSEKKTTGEYPFGSVRYAFRAWKMPLGTADGKPKNVKTMFIGLDRV